MGKEVLGATLDGAQLAAARQVDLNTDWNPNPDLDANLNLFTGDQDSFASYNDFGLSEPSLHFDLFESDVIGGYDYDVWAGSLVTKGADKGGLNLFKWGKETTTKPSGWKDGDFMLHLPDKGSAKANWKQNSGHLREQMNKGNPIYDSYRDPKTGQQIKTGGFLNAERKLLESRGWQYNSSSGAYHPPK